MDGTPGLPMGRKEAGNYWEKEPGILWDFEKILWEDIRHHNNIKNTGIGDRYES